MIQLHYRTGKNGVPILKNTDIETDAELLLRDYKPELLTDPQPLDTDDFTESYLGLNIHFENLSRDQSIWGCMVFNNRQIPVYVPKHDRNDYCAVDADTVVIDNSLLDGPNEYALRSTMLHECGHSLYHEQIFKEDDNQLSFLCDEPSEKTAVAVCRWVDIQGNENKQKKLATDREWIEHHAKYFSAAMLMPKSAMRIYCKDPKIREAASVNFPGGENEALAGCVAEIFNVSPVSARIRIRQLGLGFNKKTDPGIGLITNI